MAYFLLTAPGSAATKDLLEILRGPEDMTMDDHYEILASNHIELGSYSSRYIEDIHLYKGWVTKITKTDFPLYISSLINFSSEFDLIMKGLE